MQVSQETVKMVWYSHLLKSFSQFIMIHTVKGFSVVDETEIDNFLEFPSFLYDPVSVGNLISDSSSFSKPDLDIWQFLVHIMLKPSMQDCMHDLTSMGWLPWWFNGKEFACNAGDAGSISGSGWSPGESLRTTSISTIKVIMTSMKSYWSSCQIFPVYYVPFLELLFLCWRMNRDD